MERDHCEVDRRSSHEPGTPCWMRGRIGSAGRAPTHWISVGRTHRPLRVRGKPSAALDGTRESTGHLEYYDLRIGCSAEFLSHGSRLSPTWRLPYDFDTAVRPLGCGATSRMQVEPAGAVRLRGCGSSPRVPHDVDLAGPPMWIEKRRIRIRFLPRTVPPRWPVREGLTLELGGPILLCSAPMGRRYLTDQTSTASGRVADRREVTG